MKKQQEGMTQLRVWVPNEHVEFIKMIAKECRPRKELKLPVRYGRRATLTQIRLAKTLTTIRGKSPPEH